MKILKILAVFLLIFSAFNILRAQGNECAELQEKYENGDRSEELLYDYAFKLAKGKKDYETVMNEYLETQTESDLTSKKNWKMIYYLVNDINSPTFQYLLDNRDAFIEKYKAEDVDNKIVLTNLGYYQKSSDWTGYYAYASEAATGLAADSWLILNNIAWALYENVDDVDMLEGGLKWAEKSMDIEKNYYNTDTYAALHYKLGNYEDALKYANDAVEIAKQKGEKYEGTEELIEKIKQNM
jgi:hypothetical protein